MAVSDELLFNEGLATPADRRRPGRINDASPELVPLLRNSVPHGIEAALLGENTTLLTPEHIMRRKFNAPDDLRAARGVIIGFGVSLGFWVLCFAAMGWLVL